MLIRLGTPKTIDEAIGRHVTVRATKESVKDFMAQKFTIAMIKNPKSEEILKKLFEELFG